MADHAFLCFASQNKERILILRGVKIYDRSNPFANRADRAERGLRERGNRGDFHE